MTKLLACVCLLGALSLACDKDESSSQAGETITGRERLGWNQEAPDAEELSQYSYLLYVDGVASALPDASCGQLVGQPPVAACSSPLPPLGPGTHTLELGTRVTRGSMVLESVRSAPLVVTVTGSGTANAVSQAGRVASDALRVAEAPVVERVVSGLDRPTALARLPDGRLLVAEFGGRVRLVEREAILEQSALELTDADNGATARMSLAVDPDFAVTRHVFVGYTSRDRLGGRAGRVVRFREVDGTLGEAAVILDDLPAEGGGPRIRLGPDGMLWVASAARGRVEAEERGSFGGKILRVTRNGFTPADSPAGTTPVFAAGNRWPAGFGWDPANGKLWDVESESAAVSLSQPTPGRVRNPVVRLDGVQAADASFHTGSAPAAWRGSLFLASPYGECLYRIDGLSSSTPEPGVERLFAGSYGRIAAVMSAEDGLYFATANGIRDAEGRPTDAVYRVRDRAERR